MRLPEILGMLLLATVMTPLLANAQYEANAGAETKNQSVQANGFFPNEVWIWAGDNITWTFVPKNEIHTVTFLKANQVRPTAPPPVGPPPFPIGPPFAFGSPVNAPVMPPGPANCTAFSGSATYDGTACISSHPSSETSNPSTFKVTFPTPGNFKLVCLVHTDMTGTVHVLQSKDPKSPFYATSLPYLQSEYERQARDEASDILKDRDDQEEEVRDAPRNRVIAGIGEVVATAGGTQYRAVVRFLDGTIRIHKGDSVTWVNLDPTEPHTVTFGTEPANLVPTVPSNLAAPAGDGTLTATIACSTVPCDEAFGPAGGQPFSAASFLNSGFLQAQAPDRTAPASGDAQLPPGTTRITITFPKEGTYYYHCALHDVDGMAGKVIVEK
jgi:plastocyanin